MFEAELVVTQIAYVVCVRINEGALNKTEYIGRGDVLGRIILCPTVVTEVIGITDITHIKGCSKAAPKVNIGIETDVQTVEVSLLCCSIALGITEREVVHCHVITTLYTNAIVLGKTVLIEIALPVCLVVVLLVVKIVGIFIEEGISKAVSNIFIILSETGSSEEF